ncbi:MAG TPA: hypothetical protein VE360_12740 [Pyrinomonadaceae bacterium]|nr:hypothetical protein [Pyrinomonadaceae bacterium]
MKRTFLTSLARAVCMVFALAPQAAAQGLVDAQRTRDALTAFPDSQAVLFVNIQKIVRDALPRFVPPKDLQKLYTEPQKVGFDVKGVEYAIVGVRFAEPAPPGGAPEFVVFLRGTFNADSLLSLGRIALDAQGIKAANETYGGRTLDILDVASLNKKPEGDGGEGAPSSAPPIPYKEVAATALDANTIVVGVPAYVKAAIDAAGAGAGRLDAGIIDLATRDPNSLVSLTAALPPSVFQYLDKTGVPKGSEAERLIRSLKQVSLSTGMTALDFTMRASVHTETAADASAISGFVKLGLGMAESALRKELRRKRGAARQEPLAALAALRTLTNTTDGDTLLLGVSVPQKTVAALVKKSMAKKPEISVIAPVIKNPSRSAGSRRRRR